MCQYWSFGQVDWYNQAMKGFIEFIREQGVIGLAVGFILGGAISKLVTSLVTDIINPLVGALLGFTKNLADASFLVGGSKIMWGHFVTILIDFAIIAAVIYFSVRILRLDRLDKKKEEKKEVKLEVKKSAKKK